MFNNCNTNDDVKNDIEDDIEDDIDGEIYLITNIKNNKKYIGQALKFVSKKNIKWGTEGRWKSHIREAFSGKDHCLLLNQAIRKYGVESFKVEKLCDCLVSNMDKLEIDYIIQYDTLVPFGYNLTTGGANGKDTDETRQRKSKARIGLKHSAETRINIRLGQRGIRRNPEDKYLPDFIGVIKNKKGIIRKYYINKFYTNVDLSTHVSIVTGLYTLDQAIEKLETLKLEYPDVWKLYEDYKSSRKTNNSIKSIKK